MGFWRGRRVVITAGPTREYLDPVRYLSNESSGKMGWALARVARQAGALVTLVAGPTGLKPPKGVRWIPVVSAEDMQRATRRAARAAHAVIGAAAVADWRPERASKSKIKKGAADPVLHLKKNPDVLATAGQYRSRGWPRLAGFALETNSLLANAQKKMRAKNLDLIVANEAASFGADVTRAHLLRPGRPTEFWSGTKLGLARRILARLAEPPFERLNDHQQRTETGSGVMKKSKVGTASCRR